MGKLRGKVWREVKSDIIKLMIGECNTNNFDPLMVTIVPRVVIKRSDKYMCTLCKKWYDNYKSIFYHIAVVHNDLVERIAIMWRIIKLKKIGIEESIPGELLR